MEQISHTSSFEISFFSNSIKNAFELTAGVDVSFAFKSTFEGDVHYVVGSNNQSIRVFETEIISTNDGKPWANYLFGLFKTIDKKRTCSIGLETNLSSAFFIKGNYIFTIPGKPDSFGTYRISGSGISFRIRYLFLPRKNQL